MVCAQLVTHTPFALFSSSLSAVSIQHIPALSHLSSLLTNPSARFSASNLRTLNKVAFILRTHRVVDLVHDLPTRYLWLSNLNRTDLSPSSVFITLRKFFPNRIKRMVIPPSARAGCVYVWFKRTEDAILAMLTLLDLRPLRACFGQAFEPSEGQLLFTAIKAGILNIAGPYESINSNEDGQPMIDPFANNLAAPEDVSIADSDDLPPPITTARGSKKGVSKAGPMMGRQNSNCPNDAPVQKGKHEMAWNSYWVFVSPPDYENDQPPVLYALRKTSDFNRQSPHDTKWAFRVELVPSKCVIVRSGAWSIQVIKLGDENDASTDAADSDEMPPPSSAARLARRLTLPSNPMKQTTIYIRAHSTEQVDEWFNLLKACRAGDQLLSPKNAKSFGASSSSPPPAPSSPYWDEVTTRVFCNSCQSNKSVLDIYTLDAALDVAPTHVEPPASIIPSSSPSSSSSSSSPSSVAPSSPPLSSSQLLPTITQFAIDSCRDCLVSSITSKMEAGRFDELNAEYSVQDIQDLLPRPLFDTFLDRSTSQWIDSNPKRYIRCPKCSCPLEIDHHTWSSKSEQFLLGLVGLDQRPLNEEARTFFLNNRFLCRGCRTDFCRACASYPFHPGLTCEEYKEYLLAPKCRFCSSVVTKRTRMHNPPSKAFEIVCNAGECAEKVAQSCRHVKSCGHPCGGARDEKDCPPCLIADCDAHDPKLETSEDMCSICYTEELGQAPILKLECNHIFHITCIRARLAAKWSGTRIAFEFMTCPLCKEKMQHELLVEQLRPFYLLEDQVRQMSLQRLTFESLLDHVDIVNPTGRFYRDPEGFALDHYMFYQCYDCQEPYFAGARACGAAGEEEVNRQDLICGGCQKQPSFESCPKHVRNRATTTPSNGSVFIAEKINSYLHVVLIWLFLFLFCFTFFLFLTGH